MCIAFLPRIVLFLCISMGTVSADTGMQFTYAELK